jgi:DNA repair protein RAD5
MCPVCREPVSKHDLITVPRSSRFSVDIERNWKASSKIQALMSDLRRLFNGPPPEPVLPRIDGTSGGPERHVQKCVLVSQWTSMLDLLERPLRDEGIAFVRLDGAMSQQARCETLTRFGGDPNVPVLLLSLRAGGVGLNLVAAQTLYLLDPWWNPAVEEQAINRIHRIGQRYPVSVKRFLMERSVEERILELQKRKEALVKGALAQGEDAKAMRVEDLKELFR